MIDYRPIIVQYIKDKAALVEVRDASLTFKQPQGNYGTFYILNETPGSFVNNSSAVINVGDNTLLDEKYDPLTIVDMQIDTRGPDSFTKIRDLHKSFGTINNKKILKDQGVSFMGVSGITPLPTLKNTVQEEGYIFDLTFSFDNSFIEQSIIADKITLISQ